MKQAKEEQKQLTIEIEKLHTFLFNLEGSYRAEETKEIFVILNKLSSQFLKAKSKLLRSEYIALLNSNEFITEQRNDIQQGRL